MPETDALTSHTEKDCTPKERCVGCEASCLHQMEVGASACVYAVEGDRELRRRLLEMGFCNGVQVELVRRAPWGDPIEFSLRGYFVSLRAEQARHVKVAPVCA